MDHNIQEDDHSRSQSLQKQQKSESESLFELGFEILNALKKTIEDNEKTRKDLHHLCDRFVKVIGQTVQENVAEKSDELPVYGNIKQLHEKIIRFKSDSVENKRFQRLEDKIHALLHWGDQDYFKDFKNDNNIADHKEEIKKISFLDFLKDFDKSDSLKSLKARAIHHGRNLFKMVIFLMFLMSKDDEVMAKFKVLKESLKWVSEDAHSAVITRLLDLFHAADSKISKNKTEFILEDDEELEEDVTDELILLLMKEVCNFELFWMQRRVMPDSKIAFEEFLEADLKRCEEGLKKLEIEVNELLEASALTFGEDDHLILNERGDYKAMEAKINEMWDQTEESEAEAKRWIKKVNCEQEVNQLHKVLEM